MTESNKLRTDRDDQGRFLAGNIGNGGRKKGSRNKLGEAFISDLFELWQRVGPEALATMHKEDNSGFVRVCAALLPKEIDATLSVEHEFLINSARDFGAAFRLAQAYIGAQPDDPELIEAEVADDA
jgi:hypothetical protein